MTRLARIRAEGTDKLRDIAWLVGTVDELSQAFDKAVTYLRQRGCACGAHYIFLANDVARLKPLARLEAPDGR